MPTIEPKPLIVIDGYFTDWVISEQIDYGDVLGFTLYGQAQGTNFNFALNGTTLIGPATTFWFNTDQNAATGYQIFGFAGGAEFNVEIRTDGTAALYTGGAGETLVLDNIPLAYSTDQMSVEFSIPKSALGEPAAMNVLYDVNNSLFGPLNYSAQPYVAYSDDIVRTDFARRIGIVYSQTTADNYFSDTAYSQLFMAMQSQAMQAGISFDVLTEADLTNVAKLANYDALVFPSFANVQASEVDAITNTLLQVTKQFGVGLITAGNFLTNDENGAPLPGDSYARMKLLFDATRVTGGFPADVTLTAAEAAPSVFGTLTPGETIYSYSQVAWDAFESVSGSGQTLATETIGGESYAAALATQTGGKNVLFSTAGVMADNNLLWQAINYVAKDPGVQLSLDLTRSEGIVVSRTDMDQSMYSYNVSPKDGSPGIYEVLLPILEHWKAAYNFVGSYYVNIGNDSANEEVTDWAVSAPYYAQIIALGNELGTHSYTHPDNTNVLTPAQIEFQFEQSKLAIEQQMSAYLGKPFTILGAAVPGAIETLATSEQIIQYFDYMTGGYSSVGAGYPGAFGFLTPGLTDAVYLAPNTSFDFSLVEYHNLGADGAAAAWGAEWNQLVNNAQTPIVLWPWHDYGPTLTSDPGVSSPYTLGLFTDWIERAYASGAEFVTGAELAERIQSFYHSGVTSTINGNVIDVTVASQNAGDFALNLSGLGAQVIANVAGWYAYDEDSLFLPDAGGSFSITTGAIADNVTRIVALPMRADLLSVTGDGLNLGFSVFGEGNVLIDLGEVGNLMPVVTGGAIASLTGDMLDISLSGIGLHTVGLSFMAPAPTAMVSTLSLSADTGASASDFVTMTAAQTISGTLSAALAAAEVVRLSLDGGLSWLTANATTGDASFTLADVALSGAGTLVARVENADGTPGAALAQAYVLDQQAPDAPSMPDLLAASDSGVSATDNLTNVAAPNFSGTAEAGSTVNLFNGATMVGTGIVAADMTWTVLGPLTQDGVHTITAQAVDHAGNTSAVSTALAVTLDTQAPAAPSFVSASSVSSRVTRLNGLGEAGATVVVLDETAVIGSATVGSTGDWKMNFQVGATPRVLTAHQFDGAGNLGADTSGAAIIGTRGKNTLAGTSGDDLFFGGAGADRFLLDAGFGRDLISDFIPTGSAHDIINFRAIPSLASFADVLAHASTVGTGVVIGLDASNSITLANVKLGSLTASDFTFV